MLLGFGQPCSDLSKLVKEWLCLVFGCCDDINTSSEVKIN